MTVKIWFDPLSLKVLATKVIIRERMDYADYLGGKVKDELDQLDRLAGRQVIKATGLYVRKGKYQISNHEWKSLKKRLPASLIAFLSGKQVFSIFETYAMEWWETENTKEGAPVLKPGQLVHAFQNCRKNGEIRWEDVKGH